MSKTIIAIGIALWVVAKIWQESTTRTTVGKGMNWVVVYATGAYFLRTISYGVIAYGFIQYL